MKRPIILLHGALGSMKQFAKIEPLINREVHLLNFSGHGGLPNPKHFNIEVCTEDIINYLNQNGIDKIDVFGYSLGGYAALNTAIKHPNRIGQIITLSTKFDWNPEFTEHQIKMLNPDKIELKIPHFAKQLEQEHQDWKTLLKNTANMMNSLFKKPPFNLKNLGLLSHSIVLGIGDKDQMVSISETQNAADLLSNGELCILKDFPHEIHKVEASKIATFIQKSLI